MLLFVFFTFALGSRDLMARKAANEEVPAPIKR